VTPLVHAWGDCGGITTAAELEFRVLGPLEVLKGGRPVPLGGRRQRALLALLLLHANEPLSADRLITELWGDAAPETARKMVQNNVWQLRKLLEEEAAAPQLLTTLPGGYELRLGPDQLDADRFTRLVGDARRALARGDAATAAASLREGLALWRGPALVDFVDEAFAQTPIARLQELRVEALEHRIEADLALGSTAELVGELETLVAQYPLRERLRAHLMQALYRSGRQAEALGVYQETRRLLVEELGLEPSPALQRLERAILVQDAALEAEPPPAAPEGPPPPARRLRKTVSVLVAEIVPLAPRGDPDAARRPIELALEAAARILERHGATTYAPSGSVTGVFGVPAVHEDDPLRAVRAAAELRDALRRMDEDVPVALRAAVATGSVVAGPAAVEGGPVDLAARLERAARPDEILIDDATRRLVADWADVERIRPPGLEEPAWRLVRVAPPPSGFPRRLASPMVGRTRELAELQQAFERAVRDQLPYLFTVLGPAGIGKSRLTAEFVASLGPEATLLTGRCLPYGEGVTFWPLAEIVRQAVGADAARIAEAVAGEADAELIADRVARAVGLIEPASLPEETFWAVRKLLEALARRGPLVVVFEDLHWAEPTLLDLVEHVAEWAREAPMLLLCLARPELVEDRTAWGGGKLNATSVLLGPLTEPESRALVANLVDEGELPADALADITGVAEGNPLYLEQILALLRAGGGARELRIPPTIHALLTARLDRLPSGERAVLEHASVIGREFSRGALVDLLAAEGGRELDAHLPMLVRRDLIRPARPLFPGDEAFRFSHALLREAAYESVPDEARALLHERFADWTERTAGGPTRELAEVVGHHLEQAYRYRSALAPVDAGARALAARAAERLATAGRSAYGRGDMRAAVNLLSRAVALLEPGAHERVDVLIDLGEGLRETGELDRAEAAFAEAAEAAAAWDDAPGSAHARIAMLRLQLQTDPAIDTAGVLEEAERAVDVFEALGDEGRLAKAWELQAWVPWFRCQAAAAERALQRAIEHARRAGDTRTEAQSLHLLVGAAWFGPMPVPDAVRLCEAILDAPGEQQRIRASALRALAGLKAMQGAFGEARTLIARDRALLDDLGLRVTAASAAETYAIVELLAGDAAAAERELRAGYRSLEEMGETRVSILAALLAEALHALGRDEEALRFTEISEQATPRDDLFAHVQWRAARAVVLARLGRVEAAESLAREAVALAARTDFLVVHGDALLALATVLRAARRPGEAIPFLERALALYERKGNLPAAAGARSLLVAG
jgi:DNA-binding SARP family transcriptional activator